MKKGHFITVEYVISFFIISFFILQTYANGQSIVNNHFLQASIFPRQKREIHPTPSDMLPEILVATYRLESTAFSYQFTTIKFNHNSFNTQNYVLNFV